MEEWTNSGTTTTPNHINTAFTATSELDPNIQSVSGMSVNSAGVTHNVGGSGSNAGEINWANWTNVGTNYFSILVTPTASSGVTLENMTLSIARNGLGAPRGLYAWIFEGTYGGETLDISTAEANVNLTDAGLDIQNGGITTNNPKTFDLSRAASQNGPFSIVFGARALGGEVNGGQGNLRINDVVINGETTAIPEPSAALLLGLGGLAIALRRRK